MIKTRGAEDIARCPFRIAIVSTGLIFQQSEERRLLLLRKYGTVILDEAHKARRSGGLGETKDQPNNLLDFLAQQSVVQTLAPGFFQQHNPIIRHTVLRRRQTLEEAGLLERIATGNRNPPLADSSPHILFQLTNSTGKSSPLK